MTDPHTSIDDAACCPCGSGLAATHCCDWQSVAALTCPSSAAPAADALDAGDTAGALRACLELLSREPANIDALTVLFLIRDETGPASASLALARRICALDPNKSWAQQEAAERLIHLGKLAEAEIHARNALRLEPLDPRSHRLFALVMSERHRWPIAAFHFRQAVRSSEGEDPIQLANLGWSLKMMGCLDEARRCYERSVAMAPDIAKTYHGWSQLEEAARALPRALELADRAAALAPDDAAIALVRANLLERLGDRAQASALLDAIIRRGTPREVIDARLQKGRLLDKSGDYAGAFASFAQAKETMREGGRRYAKEAADDEANRLKSFFVRARVGLLPRAQTAAGAQPLFICGAPRSGTTLLEQMLTRHDSIAAGDELPSLGETIDALPRLLDSTLRYPEALADLWMADRSDGLDALRDCYLRSARRSGVATEGARFFTDKMPFNDAHLGLIGLVFPDARIVRMIRHPLDVVLSMFSYDMTHGFDCATSLEGIAYEYVRVAELAAHYEAEMSLHTVRVKYESLVGDPGTELQTIFALLGIPYDPICLRFDENPRYARTISYAQVTQGLTKSACFRYRSYLRELEPAIAILKPTIEALGYEIEGE